MCGAIVLCIQLVYASLYRKTMRVLHYFKKRNSVSVATSPIPLREVAVISGGARGAGQVISKPSVAIEVETKKKVTFCPKTVEPRQTCRASMKRRPTTPYRGNQVFPAFRVHVRQPAIRPIYDYKMQCGVQNVYDQSLHQMNQDAAIQNSIWL